MRARVYFARVQVTYNSLCVLAMACIGTHTRNAAPGKRQENRLHFMGLDHEKTVWLAPVRSDLRQKVIRSDTWPRQDEDDEEQAGVVDDEADALLHVGPDGRCL
jgi:hypothetical protein